MRMKTLRLILLLAGTLLAGCISFGHRETPETQALRRELVLEALGQIGRPYRYGGNNSDGFDCSGLVQYVYREAGVQLPRSTREQHAAGKKIDLDEALPGDLLFYRFSGRKIDHVAMYLGDGEAVHAPARGRTVIVAPVAAEYWMDRFVDAVRVLN